MPVSVPDITAVTLADPRAATAAFQELVDALRNALDTIEAQQATLDDHEIRITALEP